jgi:hypothetical protein
LNREEVEQLGEAIFSDGVLVFLSRDVLFEADVQSRALICLQYVPHLGFAEAVFLAERESIARMHLNGEICCGVNEFYEHGEAIERLHVGAELLGGDCFGERSAVTESGQSVGMEGKLPGFGTGGKIGRLSIGRGKLASAPKVVLECGIELFNFHVIDPFCNDQNQKMSPSCATRSG